MRRTNVFICSLVVFAASALPSVAQDTGGSRVSCCGSSQEDTRRGAPAEPGPGPSHAAHFVSQPSAQEMLRS